MYKKGISARTTRVTAQFHTKTMVNSKLANLSRKVSVTKSSSKGSRAILIKQLKKGKKGGVSTRTRHIN